MNRHCSAISPQKISPKPMVSGKLGGALLVIVLASIVWITEVLRWTVYDGKVPGSYMPDWLGIIWIYCLLISPSVSLILVMIIGFDKKESFTSGFLSAVIFGCSPLLVVIAYLVMLC